MSVYLLSPIGLGRVGGGVVRMVKMERGRERLSSTHLGGVRFLFTLGHTYISVS